MDRTTWITLAMLAVTAGCGGYSQQQMDEKLARIHELEQQVQTATEHGQQLDARLTALEAQNAELVQRVRRAGQSVEGLESERANLQSSLAETQRALEELRSRERAQQGRLATFRGLLERFRSMISSGRLRVRVVRNRMVIELADNILFDSGRADLKPEGEQALTQIAGVLTSIADRQFQVCGHTDNVPVGRGSRFDSNWQLSAARAVTVARFLIAQGVPEPRLSAAGYADTEPVSSNNTDQGRAQNRRIEIVLMPNLDELPDLSSLSEGDAS